VKVFVGLWRLLQGLALGLLAIVFFIEEWGWRPLTAMAARIARWPPVARLELRVVAAPRHLAVLLFMAPATLLFPLKLAALWLIGEGHPEQGILLIIVAKVLGTALVGRMFILLEPQLLSFPWFARALRWWRRTKAAAHGAMRGSRFWRRARAARRGGRQ
jgi:hypothetical protein